LHPMPTASEFSATPRIVIAPDSFKGSLGALQVAQAVRRGIHRAIPHAQVDLCPMADGGEGTLDAMVADGGVVQQLLVRDACGERRAARVAILRDGSAVIETAEIVGITDPAAMAIDVGARSTEGIGDAILALAEQGVRRFLIALGGSSTNDGGSGMLRALGLRLVDAAGVQLAPGPAALAGLHRIDAGDLHPLLAQLTIIGMSDVENLLCGSAGATAVFGPQKGVDRGRIDLYDQALAHFAAILEAELPRQAATRPGSGAAGGLGYALLMIGGAIRSGAEMVCTEIGLDRYLAQADLVITGEGRSDSQTLSGKAPAIVARHAARLGVPAVLLSGAIDRGALAALNAHFAACLSIVPGPMTLGEAIADAADLTADCAAQVASLWMAGRTVSGAAGA
jgi:glycerate kinase